MGLERLQLGQLLLLLLLPDEGYLLGLKLRIIRGVSLLGQVNLQQPEIEEEAKRVCLG